jgi:hypothetical protein
MIVTVVIGVIMLRNYLVLRIQVTFGVWGSTDQTIPFFEALAILDQMQTNQEIHQRLMLDDTDFKKNMWYGQYSAEFIQSKDNLNDRILITYQGNNYYHKAWYSKKNLERVKYMSKKKHTWVVLEVPMGLRLLMTDRLYVYYVTQDLGMRYSYLYNVYDSTSMYIHGELVYSYLGNNIFFTYDHELPYEFMILNQDNKLLTQELGWFVKHMFVDGRYIYMQIDDFQWKSRINIYDAVHVQHLYKIPFGYHNTARIGFKPSQHTMNIEGYVINKLYLYVKYYDTDAQHTYLKKIDLVANKEISSLQM